MTETTITLTELKRHLSHFVKRAVDDEERIILVSQGKPQAILLSLHQFAQLEELAQSKEVMRMDVQLQLLKDMEALRATLGGVKTDSVQDLRELREEADERMGLS
jgi:prevent-host-death family protein